MVTQTILEYGDRKTEPVLAVNEGSEAWGSGGGSVVNETSSEVLGKV